MFWLAENRARLTQPGMSVVDVTRAAGAEWNTIEDRSKWEKLAADDKKRYEKMELEFVPGG
uniref:HMG box domain-containing protein n=1 Tax=Parascaris univalens TaxID=6257 RepID=A0A915A0Y2_PARUN